MIYAVCNEGDVEKEPEKMFTRGAAVRTTKLKTHYCPLFHLRIFQNVSQEGASLRVRRGGDPRCVAVRAAPAQRREA